jgi:hypothetical protein
MSRAEIGRICGVLGKVLAKYESVAPAVLPPVPFTALSKILFPYLLQ